MDLKIKTASIKEAEACRSFVVFDTETTGLYPESEKIIEIGAVRFRDGREEERFHSFVNPGRHIPAFITDLTHISDDTVADAPAVEAVLPEFEAFVGDDPLVGHNIAWITMRSVSSMHTSIHMMKTMCEKCKSPISGFFAW